MNFREFIRLQEAGGLFGSSIWQQSPGTARVGAKDLDLHQFGTTGAATPIGGASQPVPAAPPQKKMKKK